MAALKKQHEVPFTLDDKTITMVVTKNTTCSDVIKKLQNVQMPLAVFMSVDGFDKELTGKTKLLKIWRANAPTRKFEFVIRKSQMFSKVKKSSKKLSSGKQSRPEIAPGSELSKDTLKQVSDLAFYVRYQQTKLQALEQNSDIKSDSSEQNRLMKRLTSNASVNSMDAFLAKVDLNEMAKFLTFCGEVTAEKLSKGKLKKQFTETESCQAKQTKESSKYNKSLIRDSLKSSKLGLKQKFSSKRTVERAISSGTMSSTDTGYHSVGSEYEPSIKTSTSTIGKSKSHISILTSNTDTPRHSTPLNDVRTKKRRADDIDTTLKADTTLIPDHLEQMNEKQGKSIILQKFMADQTFPVYAEYTGNDEFDSPDVKRRRMERYSMPAFENKTNMRRSLWDKDCESDFDCEDEFSESCDALDVAFNAGVFDFNCTQNYQSRTLRRESAISNLNRFSLVSRDIDVYAKEKIEPQTKTLRRESAISNLNRFSLPPRDIGLDTFDESSGFDYSFDCSFPRMDETKSEDFSMNFSYDYDESDIEDDFICGARKSLMKTRSSVCSKSDLRFGSMSSRSITECREPEIII